MSMMVMCTDDGDDGDLVDMLLDIILFFEKFGKLQEGCLIEHSSRHIRCTCITAGLAVIGPRADRHVS